MKANDRDIGENARSTYNIIDGDERDIFEIITDPQTQEGVIQLRKVSLNTKVTTVQIKYSSINNFILKCPFFQLIQIHPWTATDGLLVELLFSP